MYISHKIYNHYNEWCCFNPYPRTTAGSLAYDNTLLNWNSWSQYIYSIVYGEHAIKEYTSCLIKFNYPKRKGN